MAWHQRNGLVPGSRLLVLLPLLLQPLLLLRGESFIVVLTVAFPLVAATAAGSARIFGLTGAAGTESLQHFRLWSGAKVEKLFILRH